MNKSSNLKKIISLMLIVILTINILVLPVSAKGEAGDYTDRDGNDYSYEDLSDCPVYRSNQLVYKGTKPMDLTNEFNVIEHYGMGWCLDSGFYMSRPFSFYQRLNKSAAYRQIALLNNMMSEETFNTIANSAFVQNSNLDLSAYDVYYMLRISYDTSDYGQLILDYWFAPKGHRIAMSNQGDKSKNDESTDNSVYYGLWLSTEAPLDTTYESCFHATLTFKAKSESLAGFYVYAADKPFYSFLGGAHLNTVATNIPIFTDVNDAKNYVLSGDIKGNPSNKIPDDTKNDDEKIGADSFYWDSLKCRLVQVGGQYKAVFDYSYSATDMVDHPSEYHMNVDYTQTFRYKLSSSSNVVDDRYKQNSTALNIGSSPGSVTDTFTEMNKSAYGIGTGVLIWIGQGFADVFGADRDFTSITLYSSYITVYVELVHVIDGGNGLSVKDKVSSDIRHFTFDALTLKSLDDTADIDPVSEDKVEVKTEDTVDSDGNVTDRTVTGSTVINNTTNTVNNYYYDSDGNKTDSSGSSIGDSLSDIASGLIKFIKTLVTEGLPAALEILKSLIKNVSDLFGFISDQIGDIGQGTQNGIIAVLKAIPVPLWGICSVALIVFVIVGILKHIF